MPLIHFNEVWTDEFLMKFIKDTQSVIDDALAKGQNTAMIKHFQKKVAECKKEAWKRGLSHDGFVLARYEFWTTGDDFGGIWKEEGRFKSLIDVQERLKELPHDLAFAIFEASKFVLSNNHGEQKPFQIIWNGEAYKKKD